MITITQCSPNTSPAICIFCQKTEDWHVSRFIFSLKGDAGFGIMACNHCLIELRSNLAIDEPKEESLLNAYGEYALKFAETHGLTIDQAYAHPMVKARLEFFNATGR